MARPVHFQHYKKGEYVHTVCGLINFTGYRGWPFTRSVSEVTCKRCNWTLERDGGPRAYRSLLAEWKKRKAKKS